MRLTKMESDFLMPSMTLIAIRYAWNLQARILFLCVFVLSLVCCGGVDSGGEDADINNDDSAYGFVKSYGDTFKNDYGSASKELGDGTLITAGSFEDGTPWIGKMDAEGNLYDQFSLQLSPKNLYASQQIRSDGQRLVLLQHNADTFLKLQLQQADQSVVWTREYPNEAITGVTADYSATDEIDYETSLDEKKIGESNSKVLFVTPIDAIGSDGSSFYMVMQRNIINERVPGYRGNKETLAKIYQENVFWVQKVSALSGNILWRSSTYRHQDNSIVSNEQSLSAPFLINTYPSLNGYQDMVLRFGPVKLDIEFNATGGVRVFYIGYSKSLWSDADIATRNTLFSASGLPIEDTFDSYSYGLYEEDLGQKHPELANYHLNKGVKYLYVSITSGFFRPKEYLFYDENFNRLNTLDVDFNDYHSKLGKIAPYCGVANVYADTDCVYYWVSGAGYSKLSPPARRSLILADDTGNELYKTDFELFNPNPSNIKFSLPYDEFIDCYSAEGASYVSGHNLFCAYYRKQTLPRDADVILSIYALSAQAQQNGSGFDYRLRKFEHTVTSPIYKEMRLDLTESISVDDAVRDALMIKVDADGISYKKDSTTRIYLTMNPAYNNIGIEDSAQPLFLTSEQAIVVKSPIFADEKTQPFTNLDQTSQDRFTVTDITELENGNIIVALSPGKFSSSKVIVALNGANIIWSKNLYEALPESSLGIPVTPGETLGLYRARQVGDPLVHTKHNNSPQTEAQLQSVSGNEFVLFLDGVLIKFNGITGDKIWERSWKDTNLLTDPLYNETIHSTESLRDTYRYNDRVGSKSKNNFNKPQDRFAILASGIDHNIDTKLSKMANNDLLVSMPILNGELFQLASNPEERRLNKYRFDLFLARVDKSGKEIWKKVFVVSPTNSNNVPSINGCLPSSNLVELPNGNILMATKYDCGSIAANTIFLSLLSAQGDVILTRKIYNTESAQAGPISNLRKNVEVFHQSDTLFIDVNKAGQIWLGYTFYPDNTVEYDNDFASLSSLLLIQLDKNLNPLHIRSYGGLRPDNMQDLKVLQDGGVLVTAETNSITNSSDIALLRLGADGLLENTCQALIARADGKEVSALYFKSKTLPQVQPDAAFVAKIKFDTTTETREVYDINDTQLQVLPSHQKIVTSRSCSGPAKKLPLFFGGERQLTITPPSNGKIIDNSRPVLINCGSDQAIDCQASYGGISNDITSTANGLVLTAVADDLFIFKDWTGDCAGIEGNNSSGEVISVDMNADKTCSATFIRGTAPITTADFIVSLAGSGAGYVSSGGSGIDCGTDCSATFNIGSELRLTAFSDAGNQFSSWRGTGDCAALGANAVATISVSQNSNCIAIFEPIATTGDVTLTVVILGGPDAGVVTDSELSSPNMFCLNTNGTTTTCTAVYAAGSVVDLFGSASAPNNNVSWNNCDSISEIGVCRITMTQDETVSATFSERTTGTIYSISVSGSVDGGDITSVVPAGITGSIDCPDVKCADLFIVDVSGTISIHATPKPGSIFMSWGANQCDSESRSNGVGICTMDLINGSPPTTTRRADAFFSR